MNHPFRLGVLALIVGLGAVSEADAQTTPPPRHRHAKPQSDGGRQITIHKSTPSWLTLGGESGTAVTSPNNYVYDTFSPPTPNANTIGGWRGQESLPINRFDGPGIPIIRFW
jgi:hypothetical protein